MWTPDSKPSIVCLNGSGEGGFRSAVSRGKAEGATGTGTHNLLYVIARESNSVGTRGFDKVPANATVHDIVIVFCGSNSGEAYSVSPRT